LSLRGVKPEQSIDLTLLCSRLPAQPKVLDLSLGVMPAQITLFTLDDVNRGQSERPRATHAAAQIERIL
jgi:hypothetical protein